MTEREREREAVNASECRAVDDAYGQLRDSVNGGSYVEYVTFEAGARWVR
ncbi:hypothetical protein [Streptomyces spongiae]|nr:hypothetical protein [Streptomyces spongiae]